MLRTLTSDDERFQEILVQVLNQGIQFDGWVSLTSSGISLVGYRVVAIVVEPLEVTTRPASPTRSTRPQS